MASTRGQRLREARKKRFKSANLAAEAMGIPVATYGAHERAESPGGRDYGPEEAKRYARRFGVTPEWLLVGSGAPPVPAKVEPVTVLSLIAMLQVIMSTLDICVADLERIAATIPYADRNKQPKLKEGGLVKDDPEVVGALHEMIETLRSLGPAGEKLAAKLRQDYKANLAIQIVVDE